jgi:hypothetical protein
MNLKLVSIKKWKKDHVVKQENNRFYNFYCGRSAFKKDCEDANTKNYCASCYSLANLGAVCSNRENEIGVKSIVRCPNTVSETGLIKIVGDQTQCKPNVLQPGNTNWDYLAVFFDPDYPNESHPYFEVTKQEIEEWKELYK